MVRHWWARITLGSTSAGSADPADDRPDPQFEAIWRPCLKGRLKWIIAFLIVWAVGVEARLLHIQVISHDYWVQWAIKQSERKRELRPSADRGDVLDRNGEVLAYTVEGYTLNANPSQVADADAAVAEICDALRDCTAEERATFRKRLTRNPEAIWVQLRDARALSPAAAARITDLAKARREANPKAEPMVWVSRTSRRFYPKGPLASHAVGFVDYKDNVGKSGIEAKYDRELAGEPGKVIVEVDRDGREVQSRVLEAPVAGASVELTIDLRLQHIAERELHAAIEEYQGASGSIVILNPHTGEVLADANYPSYDPNQYWREPADAMQDRAVTYTYEPGSTFKLVTGSAALDEQIWSTTELIDTNPGMIRVPGRSKPIDEAQGHNYKVLSFQDALVKSSNVGAILIGQRVGGERLARQARRMGFGEALGPDFGTQSRGQMPAGRLSDSTLASLSMGYEVGVTPVQVGLAASSIANGGRLMEPRLVRAWIRDGRREEVAPKVVRQVMKPETAAAMTTIMEGVVEYGTAKAAHLDRYRVAGKTGTAQKVINRRYSDNDHDVYVSFVGFVPSREPVLTILVVIDSPRRGRPYGGSVAAPVFKRVAEAALVVLGVPPSVNPLPPILRSTDMPSLFTPPARPSVETVMRVGARAVMPDLRGLSLREALRRAQALELAMTTDGGDGFVVAQAPSPGEFVDPGATGTLQLRRLPPVARSPQ